MSLKTFCIFAAENARDVASAVFIMVASGTQFAVRGHGHMMVKGAASTMQGVRPVCSKMENPQLSLDRQVLSVEHDLD